MWVTKYAPPGKVGAYMSVHVFLTGVRGTVGPLIGFWTVRHIGPTAVGMVSLALMILATVMLIPEIKHGRIVVPHFEGHHDYFINDINIFTSFAQFFHPMYRIQIYVLWDQQNARGRVFHPILAK